MAFRFKLRGILKIRELEEAEAREALFKLKMEEARIFSEIRANEREEQVWGGRYNEAAGSEKPEQRMLMIGNYLLALAERRKFLFQELKILTPKIQEATDKLKIIHQRRRQLEILRDKQKAAYEYERKQKEQREVNEMSTLRFINQRSASEEL